MKFTAIVLLFFSLHAIASDSSITLSADNIPPDFTAEYEIRKGGMKVGEMNLALKKTPDNDWVYQSSTIPKGIAAVFLDNQPVIDRTLLQLSEELIRPVTFEHIQKTSAKDRSQYVSFDWSNNIASSQYKGIPREIELPESTFDNFSLQLLLMANVHNLPEELHLPVISKGKFKLYKFYKVGEQDIDTVYGKSNTLLIERRKDNKKKSTYKFWVDPKHYGLPLQFEKIENGKREYIARIVETSFIPVKTAAVQASEQTNH